MAEIDDGIGGFRLRGENKASLIDYMKTKSNIGTWPKGSDTSDQNLYTRYILDPMGFLRTKMSQYREVAISFAERILSAIIRNRPANYTGIHIVADRYDGMHGYINSCGDIVYLKDAIGYHRRRMANSVIHHIGKRMPVENWKGIFSNAASKANLI